MFSNALVRRATQNDLPVMQMILQTSSPDWRAAQLTGCFSKLYFQWAIAIENILIGFVIVKQMSDFWELQHIVIEKQFQGRGFSKQLLLAVIDDAKKNHIQCIQLDVRESNQVARALYEKCGFIATGRRKKYYADGEDAVLMDKNI